MSTKKNYVVNAQIGSIHKIALNDFFSRSQTYEIKLTKIDHKSGKYEGLFSGRIKSMSYSKDFEDKVLDFMDKQNKFNDAVFDFMKEQKEFNKEQKEFNKEIRTDIKDIKSRLDVLESFHRDDFKKMKKSK